MVYKKYIKRDGKTYGPYLYHSIKKDGKVTTKYLGSHEENKKHHLSLGRKNISPKVGRFVIVFLSVVAVALLINLVFVLKLFSTGNVASEIQQDYVAGEEIKGQVNLILQHGELFPASSSFIIDNAGNINEYNLQDLISNSVVEGNFYVKDKLAEGSGFGYGVEGEKEVFPSVLFSFRVVDSGIGSLSGSTSSGGGEDFDVSVVVKNDTTSNDTGDTGGSSGDGAPAEETEEPPIEETPTGQGEDSSLPDSSESQVQEPPIGESPSEVTEVAPENTVPPSETTETAPESTDSGEDSGVSSEEPGPSESAPSTDSAGESTGITGEIVEGDIIEGFVSKVNDYEYDLPEGYSVEIVESDQEVNFEIKDGKAVFTTDYSDVEKGFGEDYITDEILIVPISLTELGLIARQGTLKISFNYNEQELTSASQKIVVEGVEETEETNESLEFVNETVTAQNLTNMTREERIRFKFLQKDFKIQSKVIDELLLRDNVRVIIELKQGKTSIGKKLGGLDFEVLELNEFNLELLNALSVDEIIIDEPVSLLVNDAEQIIRSADVRNEFGLSGQGKKICIIDTGVEGSVTDFSYGWDFVNDDNDPTDDHGHGTQVAYIAKTIAPDSEIVAVKVIDSSGNGYESDVLQGLQYCIDENVDIISFSIGAGSYSGFCDSNVVAELANTAVSDGIFVSTATGNDENENLVSPACASKVTRVSATDKNDNIASFANVNEFVDVFAPGKDIQTKTFDGSLVSVSGTSASAPMVAGSAALILENESLQPEDLTYRFASTGKPIEYNGINISRIDVYNAVINNFTMWPYGYVGN
ncbi:MAG: S8 family serine peptidase, partial [Nanoarchaeota archaeon]|nr:S8 family serine peptidase [Nanoarchaeota archaeon]